MQSVRVVILSVPYTEPLPMVAPVLLSACLNRAGITSSGIDFSVEFLDHFINKSYWPEIKNLLALGFAPTTPLPCRAIIDILKFIRRKLLNIKHKYNPEYIGLSLFTNESINFSYILIPYIQRYLPGVKIMLGGRALELVCGVENRKHYEKYWDHGMADLVIVGDAETAIINAINEDVTGIYHASPQDRVDLENIPIPNWDNYDFSIYTKFKDYNIQPDKQDPDADSGDSRYIAVTGSKGCVRNCSFCDVAEFWPKYIYRDGEKIAEEIIVNYKKTSIRNFKFTDNLINGSISHYRRMNERLAQEIPNQIRYSGYAIFRSKTQMPADDFILARKAGCHYWAVGVESGSERIRYDMKKKFSNDDLDHGIVNLHKNGIAQGHLLIVGYPTETEWDYLETENYLRRYAHLNTNSMIKIGITPTFQLLGNSPLVQNPDYRNNYQLNFNLDDNLTRYFWTSNINPENTFDVRYNRWNRLVNLAQQLNYSFTKGMPMVKWHDELVNLKKIYDEKQPKKVYPILASK
jgi:radical SAM superfamily enzyme YgiQ (UPF0313 family)